ncbi:MAG TPA: hypothetical protein VG755_23325 [Nannocystaceae bacterium]|nr:hypothetical protein [Nannocystaceae bacterium]
MIAAPSLLALLLAHAEPAASEAQIEVAARDCGMLDAVEVTRLLRIELLAVTQEIRSGPPLEVELRCASPTMTIAVSDPLTGKRLARDVPLPADEPGRERVVALAIAQLFAASWLELLLPSEPAPPASDPVPPKLAPEPAAVAAARTDARKRVRPRSLAVAFGGVVRGRALERTPTLTGGGEIDLRGWFGDAAIVVRVGLEAGSARRPQGNVRALAVIGSVGAAGRVHVGERWDLGGLVLVGGGFARLRGDPSQPGVEAGGIVGGTGQLMVGGGPRLRLGRIALELDAEIGGMLRTPQGQVADQRTVTLGGLFVGGALRLAIETPLRRGPR